jgi:hypothetical protein
MENEHQENPFPGEFSNDPMKNLRIENDILHLRLKAELGGELMKDSELSPELENEFLKNILAFEHAYADVQQIKLYDLLNRPPFKKAAELNETEITTAFNEITTVMEEKNVIVDFSGNYDDRVKYSFITEELFEHETDDMQLAGMTRHFCYEEFHPNHKLDIELRAIDFLTDWFEQNMNEYSWEFDDPFILTDGKILARSEVLNRINMIFESFTSFTDCAYSIADINFNLDEANEKGMGFAEGVAKYKGVLEDGQEVSFDGPFKFYMSLEHRWWSIYYFIFPGFQWG